MRFEEIFLAVFDGVTSLNFDIIINIVLASLVVFWFFVSAWAFLDARDRSHSRAVILLSAFLVLIFNIPGLIIYLIIRPKSTLEEQYWSDLEKRYLLYETAELYDCPKCAFPLQPSFLNCPNCSEVIKTKCECGANVDRYWKYCAKCGAKSTYVRDEIITSDSIIKEEVMQKKSNNFIDDMRLRFSSIKENVNKKMELIKENNRKTKEIKKLQKEQEQTKKIESKKKKIKNKKRKR